MSRLVILDTDFLSAFLKIQRIALVCDFFGVDEIHVPLAVYQEISKTSLFADLTALSRIKMRKVETDQAGQLEGLGRVEIEAITLALEAGSSAVLLTNDNQARSRALELGAEVLNIPAFLLACKHAGLLGSRQMQEVVRDLEQKDSYGFRREVRELLTG